MSLLVFAATITAKPNHVLADVTFAEPIASIVFNHCSNCHRPGQAGPFPLLCYEDVSQRAARGVVHHALVLIFVTADCLIANSYQPLLARLHKEFQSKGFEFVLIHEGPNQSPNKLKEHSKEYSVPFSIVMDAEHTIARKVGATKTPEVFVVGRDGPVLYQGRIDNLYQGFGKKRTTVTREDLRIALSQLDSGKSISIPKTDAVGCSIQLRRAAD